MVLDFMSEKKVISFTGCAAQMFLAVTFGTTECFLLAAMAYDRYVAIHNPLLYVVIMSPRVYVPLIMASYAGGIIHAVIHTVATFKLSFCASNEISHIFCDIPPLLAISCSDTHINQLLLFYCAGAIEVVTILIVLISYGFILFAILRTHSAEGDNLKYTCMEKGNLTVLTEFILKGITNLPELQTPLFGLLLLIYLISAVGNLGIIMLTKVDSKLQTPMYFFLRHLALTDLGYSTTVGPKMLVTFVAEHNSVSYYLCATQLACFLLFITCELFILSVMSYDRYVAICNPLLYTAIMSQRICWVLVAIPYLYSVFVSLIVTLRIFTASFCGYNIINHFFCDCIPLISLLCSNTLEVEMIIRFFATFDLISSLLVVLVSYLLITIAILRMKSPEGMKKAFSTCGSHLIVVTVFYGTLIFMYVQPKSSQSFETDKVSSIFYTLVIPMLNPLIYSLRNKDVKDAIKRTWKKIVNMFS
ncbi:olfactory receptor 8K3-like protein [Cricetulus griseus]|nr:olfactory receptor 8K3-like protein [Cricetulus griseus]